MLLGVLPVSYLLLCVGTTTGCQIHLSVLHASIKIGLFNLIYLNVINNIYEVCFLNIKCFNIVVKEEKEGRIYLV